MRKTTEELAREAGLEQTVSDIPAWEGYAEDFETFRRLVIENERECTEPIAIANSTLCGVVFCETTGPLIPSGTKLFAFPPAAIDRDSVIEALQLAHDHMRLYLPHYTEKHNVFDTVTRALKSQLATPDQRDEVIRLLKEKFEHIREYWNGDTNHAAMVDALNHIDDVAFEAIAAIDKVIGEK